MEWDLVAVADGGGEWLLEEDDEEEQPDNSSFESEVEKRIIVSSAVTGFLKHFAIVLLGGCKVCFEIEIASNLY